MYIINFFGDGIRYWACDTKETSWQPLWEYKKKKDCSWEEILLDLDTLKKLGYTHWNQLSNGIEKMGFFISNTNRIEIKKGARFLEKFNAQQLLSQSTLFPIYNTLIRSHQITESNQLVIIQFETGLMAKYKLDIERFQIADLTFGIDSSQTLIPQPYINQLLFENTPLIIKSDDTVARGVRVVSKA